MERIDEEPAEVPERRHETLLVWGEHDPVFPQEIGERLADYLGQSAKLHVIKAVAHCPNLEKPKAWNKLVLEFLGERSGT
jgi:pimeloyl-ACP methyl ester carboxylesterase